MKIKGKLIKKLLKGIASALRANLSILRPEKILVLRHPLRETVLKNLWINLR